MVQLCWHRVAPKGEAYHVVSLTLRGRRSYHIHAHDFAELFLVDMGTGVHRLEQGEQHISEGDLVTICPEQAHGFKATGAEGLRYLNVAFPVDTLNRFRKIYFEPQDRFWQPGPEPYRSRLTATKTHVLQGLIYELSTAKRSQFAIDRFLLNLIDELRHPALGETTLGEMPAWLRQACDKALDPAGSMLGVGEFVQAACRSHEHVSRTLQQCTGRTPTEFINEVRLRQAAHLLAMTEQKVSSIALDCRFTSLAHFYRLFRTRFGVTPHRYRVMSKGATLWPE